MSLDQRALVIGGTRGTGLLIAQGLRLQGVPVRILAHNPSRAQAQLGSAFDIIAGERCAPPLMLDVRPTQPARPWPTDDS